MQIEINRDRSVDTRQRRLTPTLPFADLIVFYFSIYRLSPEETVDSSAVHHRQRHRHHWQHMIAQR